MVKLPQNIGRLIEQGIVKSIILKGDRRDITIRIVENGSFTGEIEIITH